MAKIKYNVKGVDSSSPPPVKPGLYNGKIIECTERESRAGNQMLEVVVELTSKGDFKGRKMWYYVVTDDDSMAFRVREFLEAVGVVKPGKPKSEEGAFDPEGVVGAEVQVRVRMGKDQDGEDRGEIAKLHPLANGDAGEEDEDEEEDGDEEQDYEEMSLDELKEEIESREIEVEGKVTKKKLIAALESDDEEDGEDEDEDEDEDDDEDGVDLDELDRDELKAYIKDNDLGIKVKKAMDEDAIREAILEAEDEDEDEDEDEEEEDYSDWEIQKLKDTLQERGLKTGGKKSVLIARLKKDDEASDGDEPF